MVSDTWANCYDDGWKGVIVDEAMAHPAKFSRGLIFRIISHLLEDGLIQPGDTIADPFGGVALGALPCLLSGLSWVGCELEPRFVGLGQANIALWNSKFAGMPKFTGQAVLLQGDSRRLCEVVSAAGCVVSSPPYADTPTKTGKVNESAWSDGRSRQVGPSQQESLGYGSTPGQLGAMPAGDINAIVASPPFADSIGSDDPDKRGGLFRDPKRARDVNLTGSYGNAPGQLGTMKSGEVGAVIGSPPYASGEKGHPSLGSVNKDDWGQDGRDIAGRRGVNGSYGSTNGNIANLPPGSIDALVSSPPFAGNTGGRGEASRNGIDPDLFERHSGGMIGGMGETEGNLGNLRMAVVGSPPFENSLNNQPSQQVLNGSGGRMGASCKSDDYYGETPGQIGAETGETFWEAARLIVLQCAQLLAPGRPAVWVTKRFVKNGQIVDFTAQWIQLCESCGFRLIHHHRAMLVKNRGIGQAGIDGEITSKETARMSFFRRLHIKKNPHLAIEWEDVVCFLRV